MTTFWEQVGGRPTFEKLVRRFYEGVAEDEVLRPMYPEDDMEGAVQRLTGFLEQYWGGPTAYSDERGHPRLRMRHMPFKVNPDARDRWLRHMREAADDLHLSPADDEMLWSYLERAAHAMVNTFDE
jgi:hemoglobin